MLDIVDNGRRISSARLAAIVCLIIGGCWLAWLVPLLLLVRTRIKPQARWQSVRRLGLFGVDCILTTPEVLRKTSRSNRLFRFRHESDWMVTDVWVPGPVAFMAARRERANDAFT